MDNGRVYIDFETKSYGDLKLIGGWLYSLHPSTAVICLCYRIRHADGRREDVQSWVPGQAVGGPRGMPNDLYTAISLGYEVEAHNYSFELGIWTNIMVPRFGWVAIRDHQWRDTMAVASYYALPAGLDALCRALQMPGKDPEGARLITKYCKLHLKTAKPEIPPEDREKFIAYCKRDVLCEEVVSDYLGDLPEREYPVFRMDMDMNLHGLHLDVRGIDAATAVVDQRSLELEEKFKTLVGLNPTQGEKIRGWAAERGVVLDNMTKDYLGDLLEDGLPEGEVREALEIRLEINKASTKKLDAMARQTAPDGRARWQTRYHGAATGRQTGAGFQPLNLVKSWEDVDPEQLVRDVMHGSPEWLDAVYGDAMEAVSRASRHWINAAPGHRILAGDFAAIEGVILACAAGEDWKVDAYRAGKRLYSIMGCKIHGLDPALGEDGKTFKKTHPHEDADGKKGELAFGYQGAVNAWRKFDRSKRYTDERIVEICKAWRQGNPRIVALWRGLEDAAIEAVASPGLKTECSIFAFEIVDEWLTMILPNGKRLWYREPELRMGMPSWHRPELHEDCAEGTCRCRPVAKLTYMAQKEGQWRRVSTYGGKLTENAVQGAAREYLIPSMIAAKNAGYPLILTVYDEIVAEAPMGFGSLDDFLELMRNAPGRDWAAGWPIGVAGWEGQRYRKD